MTVATATQSNVSSSDEVHQMAYLFTEDINEDTLVMFLNRLEKQNGKHYATQLWGAPASLWKKEIVQVVQG